MLAGFIAKTVKIPAIVDADTGFGGAENAARTICELESAGLAGCHLEDQEFPKRCGHLAGKSLIASADMEEKIAAAVAAKRDKDFLLIARTDARAIENFGGAVQAGASLRRCRRRCDFSGSVANETGVSRFRQGNGGPAAGEYDRIRQIALAPIR